jgi:hypothetical protein
MLADLDLLLIAVFCTADDLLPHRAENARRRITDAEVVTLCVAQALLGIASDRRFLALATRRLSHLFPQLPQLPGYFKRRQRLADVIEALIAEFARHSPGWDYDLLIVDSTPVECARSVETVRRSQLADAADYGYCRRHSRYFWGFRLHGLFALDGTPRALALTSPKRDERDVAIEMLARCQRAGGEIVIGDKGYVSRSFAATSTRSMRTSSDPPAKTSPATGRTWPRSASASSRSSGPAKTSWASNATAPAPSTASESASANASSRSPPRSHSTTDSAAPADRSRPTPPNRAESII